MYNDVLCKGKNRSVKISKIFASQQKKNKVFLTYFPVKNSKTIYFSVSCQVTLPFFFLFFELLINTSVFLFDLSTCFKYKQDKNNLPQVNLYMYFILFYFSILLECKTKKTFLGVGGGAIVYNGMLTY